jgi:hypothetical protein
VDYYKIIFNQHEAGWIGFYDFFGRECGIAAVERLSGLTRLCKSAGWAWPFGGAIILTERHSELHRNEAGRLHRLNGPAVKYPDGFSIWLVNGVRVDEQIIMHPETQTIEQVKAEQNEEIKRIRIERLAGADAPIVEGWIKFLKGIGATRIDRRTNDLEATKEILYGFYGGRVLICHCPSTAKQFALEVPAEISTCRDAQNWLSSGLSERKRIERENGND